MPPLRCRCALMIPLRWRCTLTGAGVLADTGPNTNVLLQAHYIHTWSYQEQDSIDIQDVEVDGLLSLADSSQHKTSYLVAPPLKPHHQQAWYSQLDERPPFHHGFPAPPSPCLPVQTTRPHVHQHKERGNPLANRHGNDSTTAHVAIQHHEHNVTRCLLTTHLNPSPAPNIKPACSAIFRILQPSPVSMKTKMIPCKNEG